MRLISKVRYLQGMVSLLGVSGRQVILLVCLGIIYAGFEGVGVGMLLPVLQYIEQGPAMLGAGSPSFIATFVTHVSRSLGLSSGLPVLFILAFLPILARQLFRYVYQVYAGKVRFEAIARLK